VKKDPLGRGLSAILQDIEERGSTRIIPVDQITPNPAQPRLEMREEALAELASSIREKGLLQPIIVKKAEKGYEIIAGERRYRASLMAGLKEMPAIVKDVGEREALEISLIENLQREDLNPLEVATVYDRFIEEFGYTQQDLARKLGVDRSSVANYVRLLKLPKWIKELIINGRLTQGHARALLSLENEREQKAFVERILNEGATVREVEKASKRRRAKRSQFFDLEDTLTGYLQTRVSVAFRKNKGKITIEFYSREDLERLVEIVTKKS
jgi:ParB family transcriptional regulator, chromosome partitioning protein